MRQHKQESTSFKPSNQRKIMNKIQVSLMKSKLPASNPLKPKPMLQQKSYFIDHVTYKTPKSRTQQSLARPMSW